MQARANAVICHLVSLPIASIVVAVEWFRLCRKQGKGGSGMHAIFRETKVIPVVTIERAADAVPLAARWRAAASTSSR